MRIHILSQPHTQLTAEYNRCAYTSKVIKLCKMLTKEGIKVCVYGGDENETPAELVTCITKEELSEYGFNSPDDYLKNDFNSKSPLWVTFHKNCTSKLQERIEPGDFIGTFSGIADKPIKDAFPQNRFIELGIGYAGSFADFRVFESYAWQNHTYGTYNMDGRFYDTVIPNYFDPDEFPEGEPKDYYLFVGRMITRKGLQIIDDMARRMPNERFILAGQGGMVEGNRVYYDGGYLEGDNLEYIGVIDSNQRSDLMSHAKALICPTLYVGPFEGVHVEAMMAGTPVLTTPFGCFTETYIHGIHGFKCHTIKEFIEGAHKDYDRKEIRKYAQSRYSMDVVAKQYIKYFELLKGLDNGGFYEK